MTRTDTKHSRRVPLWLAPIIGLFGLNILVSEFAPTSATAAPDEIRIGVVAGPEQKILTFLREGHPELNLTLVPYETKTELNQDLADGRLAAASFQSGVVFDEDVKSHGWKLEAAAATVTLPMGLYSRRVRSLSGLEENATVSLPRDASELSRALVLLHNYGLIGLRDGIGLTSTLSDVVTNARSLQLLPVEQAKFAQALTDSALTILTYEDAARLSLEPARDALGMEDARSPYANVIAVRSEAKSEPWLKNLISAYRTPEVKRFILEEFHDSVRRPW